MRVNDIKEECVEVIVWHRKTHNERVEYQKELELSVNLIRDGTYLRALRIAKERMEYL